MGAKIAGGPDEASMAKYRGRGRALGSMGGEGTGWTEGRRSGHVCDRGLSVEALRHDRCNLWRAMVNDFAGKRRHPLEQVGRACSISRA